MDLITVRVADVNDVPHLAWAKGLEVSLPFFVAEDLGCVESRRLSITPATLLEAATAVDDVRLRAAFTARPPASSRLPLSYQRVPLPMRTLIGHVIGRINRVRVRSWATFPRWPLDLSADLVADLCGGERSAFSDAPTPVLLSHDIDTDEGLRNLVERFLPIEASVCAQSSNYVVPCAWSIDHGLLGEVVRRGHEIGVHGYDHSNQTPFLDSSERRRRLSAARPFMERYAVIGYRAPSLLRTAALLEDLAQLYRYDSSIPTSGGLFPVPNNGCASARPFRIGGLVEIPVTMPRDGSLRFLGHNPRQIYAIWKECAERISASGGIVSLLTHCEERFSGNAGMLAVYKEFLEHLATDRRFAFFSPLQILHLLGSATS